MPDKLVGICVKRSLDMIVGLLGILKAGGAYVPLDSVSPKNRLSYMLEDAQVQILLTQQSLLDRLPEHKALIVCLDTQWSEIAKEDNKTLCTDVCPNNLAYVIYTSGSTGNPKGVLLEHRGWCNIARAQIDMLHLKPGVKILQFASFSFDASAIDIVMALASGGTLFLGSAEELMPGNPLVTFLRNNSIELIHLTPSALAVLPSADLPSLRVILVAGEACSGALVKRWKQTGRKFFNIYGPTEATIWASYYECSGNELNAPPIGKPVPNVQLYILSKKQQLSPIGVPGELYIGGIGLARGYLNRPELTAEKFIPNPFSDDEGSRLYKTGDLVRYLPDGNIEFIGRIDHQVKIRDFRIEPGEIEAVLGAYESVDDVVVIPSGEAENKRLAAYVVLSGDSGDTRVEKLRSYLKKLLPNYMIPASFTRLEKLPVTTNGKINRKALPTPDLNSMSSRHVNAKPRDMIEKKMAAIWKTILDVEPLGIDDNFFDMGGNSLSLAMLCGRLEKQFNQPFVMSAIYANPTLASMSGMVKSRDPARAKIESRQSVKGAPVKGLEGLNHAFFTVREHGENPPLFWMCGGRMLELIQDYVDDRPAYVFDYLGSSRHIRYKTIPEIISYYLFELKKVAPHGP